jgi:small subunit ribosomal protein S6
MSKHRYEGLLVLNVKGKEDSAQKIIDRLEKDFKAEGADVESVQKMDTRHFSYAPGDLDSGFFVNFVFAAAPATLDKLRTKLKLDADVYRQQYGRLSDKKKAA